jgi:hypothetical protein
VVLEVLLVHHLIQDFLLVLVQAAAVVLTVVLAVLHILPIIKEAQNGATQAVQLQVAQAVLNMTMVLQMLVKVVQAAT